jgi:hypothetical protein
LRGPGRDRSDAKGTDGGEVSGCLYPYRWVHSFLRRL